MKPHKHAEIIKAWADGRQVQFRFSDGDEWCNRPADTELGFIDHFQYRIKPEPEFPVTNLTPDDMAEIARSTFGTWRASYIAIANAAIARAIKDGQVVIKEQDNG